MPDRCTRLALGVWRLKRRARPPASGMASARRRWPTRPCCRGRTCARPARSCAGVEQSPLFNGLSVEGSRDSHLSTAVYTLQLQLPHSPSSNDTPPRNPQNARHADHPAPDRVHVPCHAPSPDSPFESALFPQHSTLRSPRTTLACACTSTVLCCSTALLVAHARDLLIQDLAVRDLAS